MNRMHMLLSASLALAALGGCSSATPSADQPGRNVREGIRVDITSNADPNALSNPDRSLEITKGKLGDCYTQTLAARPGVAGTASFLLTVDSDGRVERADVTSDATMADPVFDACVSKALKAAIFTHPVDRFTTVRGTLAFGAY